MEERDKMTTLIDASRYCKVLRIPDDPIGKTCLIRAMTVFGTVETFTQVEVTNFYMNRQGGVEEVVLVIKPQRHTDRATGIMGTFHELAINVGGAGAKPDWLAKVSYDNLPRTETGRLEYRTPYWTVTEIKFD